MAYTEIKQGYASADPDLNTQFFQGEVLLDGVHILHIKVKDLAGNVTVVPVEIILDTNGPNGIVLLNNGKGICPRSLVECSVFSNDVGAGSSYVLLSESTAPFATTGDSMNYFDMGTESAVVTGAPTGKSIDLVHYDFIEDYTIEPNDDPDVYSVIETPIDNLQTITFNWDFNNFIGNPPAIFLYGVFVDKLGNFSAPFVFDSCYMLPIYDAIFSDYNILPTVRRNFRYRGPNESEKMNVSLDEIQFSVENIVKPLVQEVDLMFDDPFRHIEVGSDLASAVQPYYNMKENWNADEWDGKSDIVTMSEAYSVELSHLLEQIVSFKE